MNTNEEVIYIHLDDIIPNRFQPREVFDERPLKELAVSIREHGVIQPIIVRQVNDKYEIIAGERRYKASALAGLTKIPAIIRNLDDKESSKVALLENLQRKNLNAIEEAKTYQKILELDEMTQEELAKTMGKSQSAVSNKLRLLTLPDEIQDALMKDKISERHARTLLNIEDKEKQKELLSEVMSNKMTVRQLEAKIKEIKGIESGEPQLIQETEPSIEMTNSTEPQLQPESQINVEPTIEEQSPELLVPQNSENINANFISDNPLMPNFNNLSTTEDNNQEMLIIPPKDNSTEEVPNDNPPTPEAPAVESKFINFGEIENDDEEEFNEEPELFDNTNINAGNEVNLDELRENTKDISSFAPSNSSGADLDSLLRVGSVSSNNDSQEEDTDSGQEGSFKFFSPAQEAIKESENPTEKASSDDYFKAPDLINVDLPGETPAYNINNVPLSDTFNVEMNNTPAVAAANDTNSLNQAVSMLRDTLAKIESTGIKVEKDEMNLEKSYQVVIKLEK